MDYRINILTECENEEIAVAIISAVNLMLDRERYKKPGYNLDVKNLRRIPATAPMWGKMARHERFERKLNT